VKLKPYDETTDAGRLMRNVALTIIMPFAIAFVLATYPLVMLGEWYYGRSKR
jgi:hypothetical protein